MDSNIVPAGVLHIGIYARCYIMVGAIEDDINIFPFQDMITVWVIFVEMAQKFFFSLVEYQRYLANDWKIS